MKEGSKESMPMLVEREFGEREQQCKRLKAGACLSVAGAELA